MADVKTKNKRRRKVNKRADGYAKPERALGCAKFMRLTYTDAKTLVLKRFDVEFVKALHSECDGNISEMARRADIERVHVRRLLRTAGVMV